MRVKRCPHVVELAVAVLLKSKQAMAESYCVRVESWASVQVLEGLVSVKSAS